ncbi:hypothetical protein HYH02_001310 [Chlamydomonas schloesseri]|uniref:ERD4-related membrane protein n=1 Tax=Chlamydomonas schloesseri TaxID=2026947 RepID=A0A835WVP4_9CHLO|nr:hypothetical protein HYH02_001310 [Chlamydomonas schloesseri]|eukprot:KAG2454279.1 hypothetical protein HYH02_001310 [Chlamydomonas schloesseri]
MVWGGLCMFGFVVLRGWLKGPGAVFQRRQELQDLFMRPPLMFVGTIRQIWNWAKPLLSVSDADIIRSAGYDALVLTRVLQIGLQMFTFMAIFGVAVMIPIYYTGAGLATSSAALGDLSRISLANLVPGSLAYLVPFFFCYLFSAYGCFVLWINCKGYVQLRMSYFLCLDALPHEDVLAAGQDRLAELAERQQAAEEAEAEQQQQQQQQLSQAEQQQLGAAGLLAPPQPQHHQQQQQTQQAPRAGLGRVSGGGGAKVAPGPGSATGPRPVAEATEQGPAQANELEDAPEGLSIHEVELQPRSGSSGVPGRGRGGSTASAFGAPGGAAAAAAVATAIGAGGNGAAAAAAATLSHRDTAMSRVSSSSDGGDDDRSADHGSNDAAAVAAAEAAPVAMTAAGEVPYMSLHGSAWLNLFNFFNPALRLMLDHLDWMNPLQLGAALFGVRNMRLPSLYRDEPPHTTMMYSRSQKLRQWDDEVADALWGGAPLRGVPGPQQSLDLEDTGDGHQGGGSNMQHSKRKMKVPGQDADPAKAAELSSSEGEGEEEEVERDEGADGGPVWASRDLPAVLPYWRPLKVQLQLGARASKVPASEAGHVHPLPPAPQGPLPLPAPLAPPPEHLRRRIAAAHRAAANAAVAAGLQPRVSGPAAGLPATSCGAAPGPGPAGTKSRLRVGSEAGGSRWAGLMPYFMLRHTVAGRHGRYGAGTGGAAAKSLHNNLTSQESAAVTPKSAKLASGGGGSGGPFAPGGSRAGGGGGGGTLVESAWELISRPLQPLYVGKRNTRLRQIVQVPVPTLLPEVLLQQQQQQQQGQQQGQPQDQPQGQPQDQPQGQPQGQQEQQTVIQSSQHGRAGALAGAGGSGTLSPAASNSNLPGLMTLRGGGGGGRAAAVAAGVAEAAAAATAAAEAADAPYLRGRPAAAAAAEGADDAMGDAAGDGTEQWPEGGSGPQPEAIRLINARHYVVLITSVNMQRGPSWIERMGAFTYIMVATTRARARRLFGITTHHVGIGVAARANVSGAGGPGGPPDEQLLHRGWDRWVGADILRNVRRYYALFYDTVKPYEQVDLHDEDLVDPDGVYGADAAAKAAEAKAEAEVDAAAAEAGLRGGPDAGREGSKRGRKDRSGHGGGLAGIFSFGRKSSGLKASVDVEAGAAAPAATAAAAAAAAVAAPKTAPGPVAEAALPPAAEGAAATAGSSTAREVREVVELAVNAVATAEEQQGAPPLTPAPGTAPPVATDAAAAGGGGSAPHVLQSITGHASSPTYSPRQHHPIPPAASMPVGGSRTAAGAAGSAHFTRGPSVALARPGSKRFSPLPAMRRGDAALAEAAVREAAEAEAALGEGEEDPAGAAVAGVLRHLYPASFQGLVPVINHDSVDKLIFAWDRAMWGLTGALRALRMAEAANAQLDAQEAGAAADSMEGGGAGGGAGGGNGTQQQGQPAGGRGKGKEAQGQDKGEGKAQRQRKGVGGGGGCCGVKRVPEEQLNALREGVMKAKAAVKALEGQIEDERARVLRAPLGTAYFAFFNSSQDAQMLAQCQRVVPPQGPGMLLSFNAEPAPAPDDVSWPNLWSTRPGEQIPRQLGVLLLLAIIFIIPIGPVQGILSNLDVALCAGNPNDSSNDGSGYTTINSQSNKLYVDWFCNPGTFVGRIGKSLVTGVLPSVLGMVWTSVVMPHLLFLCSSLSRKRKSLSAQDREMQAWFFWYSLFNTFLGAVLGGGVFSQIGVYLKNPSSLLEHIGKALPNTANFFIQYVIARAVFNNTLRFIWPHAGQMLAAILRTLLRWDIPKNLVRAAFAHMVPSARAATFYNVILQMFMFSSAFAVVAPIILPCAWFFFLTGFFAYRYSLLYIYERSYESGGRMWPILFGEIVGCMLIMEFFTTAVLISNEAWTPGIVLVCTLTPALVTFWRFCDRTYLKPLHHPPLTLVAREPLGVRVDPLVYMPPALRPGALGWYPEQGKVWEKYGIPKHW